MLFFTPTVSCVPCTHKHTHFHVVVLSADPITGYKYTRGRMSRFVSHCDWQRRRRPSSLLAGMPSASDGVWKSSPQFGRKMKESRSACRASPPQAACRIICFVFSTSPLFSLSLRVLHCFPSAEIDTSSVGFGVAEKHQTIKTNRDELVFYGLVSSCCCCLSAYL